MRQWIRTEVTKGNVGMTGGAEMDRLELAARAIAKAYILDDLSDLAPKYRPSSARLDQMADRCWIEWTGEARAVLEQVAAYLAEKRSVIVTQFRRDFSLDP